MARPRSDKASHSEPSTLCTRTYRVTAEQDEMLKLALLLAQQGRLQSEARDLSGIVREALDAWFEQRSIGDIRRRLQAATAHMTPPAVAAR